MNGNMEVNLLFSWFEELEVCVCGKGGKLVRG